MSTLAAAFGLAWLLTTGYLAWLGSKHWMLVRRVDELEAASAGSTRSSADTQRAKVA